MHKPKAKDYNTNDGMHRAMNDWACQKDKKILNVKVLFSDSDQVYIEEFKRASKEISYKTPDGETYTVTIDGGKFENTFLPGACEMTATEFKSAFAEWVKPKDENVKILKIVWKYI